MNAREMLIETHVHIPPERALEQLTAADAERRPQRAEHSIAEIVAHMSFWQEWFCRRCRGIADPVPAPAAKGWPEVQSGSWADVRDDFVAGLERTVALADRSDQLITPAIEFPPLARGTRLAPRSFTSHSTIPTI